MLELQTIFFNVVKAVMNKPTMKSIFTFYLCVNSPLNHLINIHRVGNPPNLWGFGFLQKSAQKKAD